MTPSVLIDNARERPGRATLYEGAREVICARESAEVGDALAAMSRALEDGKHLAGYLSYELGYALEPRLTAAMPNGRKVPLLWFGVFDAAKTLKGVETDEYLASQGAGEYTITRPELTMDADTYATRFGTVKDYIAAGDIYQLNLTLKGRFAFEGDALALYRDLRRKQPVPHAALVQTGDVSVISASPELFLDIEDGRAVTRPMKGTAPRGRTWEEDREIARWLTTDLKSRAENLMIVDLMRNDLGRVAEIGSVRVNDLYTVETYETLHQMTSGVEARLANSAELAGLLSGMFPPGSVTGAPKVRAMEIIRELENEPRGVYTGAVGAISPDGRTLFNVAIRTITVFAGGEGEVGIGSGVVHDSRASDEYEECLLKMRFLTDPVREFQLIETMLFEPGKGYALLERHLERLEASAAYFNFPFAGQRIRKELADHAATLGDDAYRVRLLLHRDGETGITDTKLPAGNAVSEISYVVSPHGVESSDPFLYHKTTERGLYDGEWERANRAYGADEVIFLNQRGEVTEGSRTNIFARIDGRLLTPALTSGLLPGTLRADLLDRGEAEEAVVTVEDLARAGEVYLGNSVRGLVPARRCTLSAARAAAS